MNKYLTDLPAAWSEVTIRHLLTHTSGVPNYGGSHDAFPGSQDVIPTYIIQSVSHLPLDFTPGDRWSHSNTNYILLGMLTEQLSGKEYADFIRERIFQPVEMHCTRLNDLRAIITNRTDGYSWAENVLRHSKYESATQFYSSGGIVSTTLDLVKWEKMLSVRKMLNNPSWDQMWTPAQLNNGKLADYGFAWFLEDHDGHRKISHGGDKDGFSCRMLRFPEEELTVVVLMNLQNLSPLADEIANYYLPEPEPIKDEDRATSEKLKRMVLEFAEGQVDDDRFESKVVEAGGKIEEIAEFYRALRPLKSFVPVQQSANGQERAYKYKAVFQNTAWMHDFTLTADGKISSVRVAPSRMTVN